MQTTTPSRPLCLPQRYSDCEVACLRTLIASYLQFCANFKSETSKTMQNYRASNLKYLALKIQKRLKHHYSFNLCNYNKPTNSSQSAIYTGYSAASQLEVWLPLWRCTWKFWVHTRNFFAICQAIVGLCSQQSTLLVSMKGVKGKRRREFS